MLMIISTHAPAKQTCMLPPHHFATEQKLGIKEEKCWQNSMAKSYLDHSQADNVPVATAA